MGRFSFTKHPQHSLKNKAALEFECFRMLSYGFACSIGDQMEPYGVLNPATFKLIGKIYSQVEKYEPWARPSKAFVEAAVVTAEPVDYENKIPDSIMGAVQMLDELALQFDIIDCEMELSKYKLIILPDDLIISSDYQKKLTEYVKNDGSIISCGKGGLNDARCYPECFGVEYIGAAEKHPDFILAEGFMGNSLESGNEYVIYKQGEKAVSTGSKTILTARAPYFNREKDFFCSHRYTPSAKGKPYPVAFKNDNVILFTHPIFMQYRDNAAHWCKTLILNALNMLLPERLVHHNGLSTMTVSLLNQPHKSRANLHLLSYVPVRKSATIDIIEEKTKVDNVTVELNLPCKIKSARLVSQNQELVIENQKLIIPEVDGYAIVELNY